MTLYVTRNPHKTGNRTWDHGPLQRAEKQPHPADRIEWGIRAYMVAITLASIAFMCGWVAI